MSNARVREYRDWLERNGRDTGLTTDADLAIELGREAEQRGLSVESRFGAEFNDYYLDIKNRAERPILQDAVLAFKKQWHGQRASALEGSATLYGGPYEDALRERAEQERQKAAETPAPSIERPSDIRMDRPSEVFRGLVTGVGSAAPSLVDVGASIVTGGALSKVAATGSLANQGIRNSIAKAAKLARKKGKDFSIPSSASINAMAKSKEASIAAGAFMGAGVFTQLTGEVMHELEGLTQLDPSHPDYLDKNSARNIAMGFGAAAAIPDTILPGMVINKVMNRQAKHLVKRESQGEFKDYMRKSILHNMAGGIGIEAGTEAFQEYLIMGAERFARGEDWALNPQEQKRLIDGAILGGIGGGMFGAVATATDMVSEADKRKHEETKRAEVEEANRILKEALEEKRKEDRAQFEILDEVAKQLGEQLGTEDAIVGDTVETPDGETGEVTAVEGDNVEIQTDDGRNITVPQDEAFVDSDPSLYSVNLDPLISVIEFDDDFSAGPVSALEKSTNKRAQLQPTIYKVPQGKQRYEQPLLSTQGIPADWQQVSDVSGEGSYAVTYDLGNDIYQSRIIVRRPKKSNDIGSSTKFVSVPTYDGEEQQILERDSKELSIDRDIGEFIEVAMQEFDGVGNAFHKQAFNQLTEQLGIKAKQDFVDYLAQLGYVQTNKRGGFERFTKDLPQERIKKKNEARKEAEKQAKEARLASATEWETQTGIRENQLFRDNTKDVDEPDSILVYRGIDKRDGRVKVSRLKKNEDGTLSEGEKIENIDHSNIGYQLSEYDVQVEFDEGDHTKALESYQDAAPVTRSQYNKLLNQKKSEAKKAQKKAQKSAKATQPRKPRGFQKKPVQKYTGDGTEKGTVRLKTGTNWSKTEHGGEGKSIVDALQELPPATIRAIESSAGKDIQIQINGQNHNAKVNEDGTSISVGKISIPVSKQEPSSTLTVAQTELFQPSSSNQLVVQSFNGEEEQLTPVVETDGDPAYEKISIDGQADIIALLSKLVAQKFDGITLANNGTKSIALIVEDDTGKVHVLGVGKARNTANVDSIRIVNPEQRAGRGRDVFDVAFQLPKGALAALEANDTPQLARLFKEYKAPEKQKLPWDDFTAEGKYQVLGLMYAVSSGTSNIRSSFNNLQEFENSIGNTKTQTQKLKGKSSVGSVATGKGDLDSLAAETDKNVSAIRQLVDQHIDEKDLLLGDLYYASFGGKRKEVTDSNRSDIKDDAWTNLEEDEKIDAVGALIEDFLQVDENIESDTEQAFAERYGLEIESKETQLTSEDQALKQHLLSFFTGDKAAEDATNFFNSLSIDERPIAAEIFSSGPADYLNDKTVDDVKNAFGKVAKNLYGTWHESKQKKLEEWLKQRIGNINRPRSLPVYLSATSRDEYVTPSGDQEVTFDEEPTPSSPMEDDPRQELLAALGIINISKGLANFPADLEEEATELVQKITKEWKSSNPTPEQARMATVDATLMAQKLAPYREGDALPMRVYHSTDRVFNKYVEFYNAETGESLQAMEMVEFRNPFGALKGLPKEIRDGFRSGQIKLRVKDMFDLGKVGSGLGSQTRGFGVYVSTGDKTRAGYKELNREPDPPQDIDLRFRREVGRGEEEIGEILVPLPLIAETRLTGQVVVRPSLLVRSLGLDADSTHMTRIGFDNLLREFSVVSEDNDIVLDQVTIDGLEKYISKELWTEGGAEYTGTIPDDGFVIDDIPVRYQSDMVKNAMLAVNAEIRNLAKNIKWRKEDQFSYRTSYLGKSAAKVLDDIFLFIDQEIRNGNGASTLAGINKLDDESLSWVSLNSVKFIRTYKRHRDDYTAGTSLRLHGTESIQGKEFNWRLRDGESPGGQELRDFYEGVIDSIVITILESDLSLEQQQAQLDELGAGSYFDPPESGPITPIPPKIYAGLINKHGLYGSAHADRYSRPKASFLTQDSPVKPIYSKQTQDSLKPRELGGEIDYNYVITNPKVVKDLERVALERAEEAVDQQLRSEDTISDFIGAANAGMPFSVNSAIDRIKEFMIESGIEDEITTRLLNRMRGDKKLEGVKVRFLSQDDMNAPENSHIRQDFEMNRSDGSSTAALWYMGSNVIYIPSFLQVTPEQLVQTLTHEIFHPFLFRHLELGAVSHLAGIDSHFGNTESGRSALNAYLEGADQIIEVERAYGLLKKILQEAKQSLPAESWFNGLLNMDEFTNDILNNREFQKYLASVQLSDDLKRELGLSKEERGIVRTLWDAFVQLINRLFNATEGTALAEGLEQLKVILHASDSYMIPRQMIEGEAGGFSTAGVELSRDPGPYEALGVPRVTEELLENITSAQIDLIDAMDEESVAPEESMLREELSMVANRVLRQTQENPLEVRHGSKMSPDDLQAAHELFRRSYEEATGAAFSYDQFVSRARNWTFIGNEKGYVAVREQDGGLLKLVGSAGDKRLVFRAMQSLIEGDAPVWGAVTEDLKDMSSRIGMYSLSTPETASLIKGLSRFMRSLPIQSVNDDGSITVNTPSGAQNKFLIGNKAYLDLMENKPPIKMPFSKTVMKKVMDTVRRQTDAPMRMQVQAQRQLDANVRIRRAGEAAGANTFIQAVEVAFKAIKAKRPKLDREAFNQMLGLDNRHASAKILNQAKKDGGDIINSTLRDGTLPQRKMAAEIALKLLENAREKARNRIESIDQKLSEDGDFLGNSESEFALLRTKPRELVTELSVGSRFQLQLRRKLAALKKHEHDTDELVDLLPDSLNADENNAHDIYKKLMELNDVRVDKLGKLVSSLVRNEYFGSENDTKETRVGVSMLDAGMGENELQAKFIHKLMGGREATKAYRLYEAGTKQSFNNEVSILVSLLDGIKDTKDRETQVKQIVAITKGTSVQYIANAYARQYFRWLDVKNKNPELTNEKEDLTVFDSVLYPVSIRLRQGLGDLEKFELINDAKMMAMRKNEDGSWNLDHAEPFTVKFTSDGKLEDRKELSKQVMLNNEFIKDQANIDRYGDNLWFDMLTQQTEATMKAVTTNEWAETKMYRLSSILHSIESKASKLGYMGKSVAGMMSQSRQILMQELPKAELLGRRWERALMELSKHFDARMETVKNDIYHQAIKWIEDHPEYYDNETALFNNLWSHLKERGAVSRSKYNASGKKLTIQLMRRTKDALDYELVLARKLGNKVRDAKIIMEANEDGGVELKSRTKNRSGTWVQSLYDPEVMVPLSRDPIERGWLTASRRLRSNTLSILSETMGKQLAWDGLLNRINKELTPELSQIDDEKQQVLSIRKFLDKYITDAVLEEFIEPYATSTSPIELFSTREDSLGMSTKIPQSQVSDMWVSSAGNTAIDKYVNFVSRLYDFEGQEADAQSFSSYLVDVTKLMHKQYAKLQDHALKATGENELGMSDAMAHRMMDSRDIRTMIPERFFQYDSYDAISMKLHLGMISANAAFGRDASVLEAHMKSIGGSVERRTSQYINFVQKALGDGRIDPNAKAKVKLKKREREKVVKSISDYLNKSTADAEKYFKSLESGIESNNTLKGLRGNLREYFQGQDGPFRDFKLAYELLGLQAFMMLNQPKSGIINLLSIKSFPAVFKGANAMSVKATWGSVLEVANQTLGGMVEALGMEAWETSTYGEYLNDMFFRTTGEDLDLQDYMLNTGIGGSGQASTANKVQMLTRSYRDFKRYTPSKMAVSDRKRKPIHLKTMIPLIGTPFSYFGEIANHSIAVGTVKAYEYLVRKAADYINTAKPQLDYEITGNDIGFDKQKLSEKLFFGGEEGFDFMQEKLAEHGLPSVTQLARDYIARSKNGDNRIITKDAAVGMAMISMNEVSLEGPGAKPAWMYDSRFRWFSPLLGWSFAASRQTGKAWQSPEGKFSRMALVKWFAILAAMELPLTMAFMFLMDWYDEDLSGKTPSLPKISPVNVLPGVAAFNMVFSDTRSHIIERAARAGIGGIAGEMGASLITQADPTRGARPLSVDSRVVATSIYNNVFNQLIPNTLRLHGGGPMHTLGFNLEYNEIIRPALYTIGANGALHTAQILTNLLDPIDVPILDKERQVADYIGLRAAIRSSAVIEGHDLREVNFSGYRPSLLTALTRDLLRRAIADDADGFEKTYKRAIEEAKRRGKPDPEKYVYDSFKARNLRQNIIDGVGKIDDETWMGMLGTMNPRTRSKVQNAELMYNTYLRRLEPDEYTSPYKLRRAAERKARRTINELRRSQSLQMYLE